MLKYMMKQRYKKHILLFLLVFSAASSFAQLKGVITDSITHEPLMYISVYYEGKGVGGVSNANGEYQIETRKGWNEVTFSSVGYRTKVIKITPGQKVLNVQMAPDDVMLTEVVVKPKKEKYSKRITRPWTLCGKSSSTKRHKGWMRTNITSMTNTRR